MCIISFLRFLDLIKHTLLKMFAEVGMTNIANEITAMLFRL